MRKFIVLLGAGVFICALVMIGSMTIKGNNETGDVVDSEKIPKDIDKHPPIENKKEDNAKPMVALTFDDGPNAQYTPQLLEILDKYNAKATFFMVGTNIETNPKLVTQVAEKGHEIGNHTYSHKDLMSLDHAGRTQEIQRVQELVYTQTGVYPRWLRPPYGSADVSILEQETKMDFAFWSVDTRDWESRDSASILAVVEKNIKEGDIILFHDLYGTSIEAVEQILEKYASSYQFVTISTMYDHTNAR